MSADQAKMVRDARGMPEFVFNPRKGETSQEALRSQGQPDRRPRLVETKYKPTGEEYNFTVAHWAPPRPLPQARQGDQGGGGARSSSRSTTCWCSSPRTTSSTGGSWIRGTAPSFPTSAWTSRSRSATRSSTARSRARWCSSASSAARPGACSRARPGSRTRVQGAAFDTRRRGRGPDLQGGALRPRRGAAGGARRAGGDRRGEAHGRTGQGGPGRRLRPTRGDRTPALTAKEGRA